MAKKKTPPITTQGAINLVWTLAEEVPETENGIAVEEKNSGLELYRGWLSRNLDESGDETTRRFLEELAVLMGSALRNLRYYVKTYSESAQEIETRTKNYIDYLDSLATVTSLNGRSMLPRILAASFGGAGGLSVSGIAAGDVTGSTAAVVAILAATVAAGVMEFVLRYYRSKRIDDAIEVAHDRKELVRLEALGGNGLAELRTFGKQVDRLIARTYGSRFQSAPNEIDEAAAAAIPYIPNYVQNRIIIRNFEGDLQSIQEGRKVQKAMRKLGYAHELVERLEHGSLGNPATSASPDPDPQP